MMAPSYSRSADPPDQEPWMNLARRQFLHLLSAVAAQPASPVIASAQTYPARPVRLVVGQTAGAAPDVVARLMAHWLSARLGQQFVVDNRPGAGTNLAAEAVVRAPGDGYTILLVGAPNAINATLYEKLSFDFLRDIAPVASFLRTPEVLVVHPSLPTTTVPELLAYAKANPGKANVSSPGVGSGPHISLELLKWIAGIDMTHVPYRGGAQAMIGLLGGQVQANFAAPLVALEHIRAGRLRALAVTTLRRSHVLPDVPAMAEYLPGFESGGFFGIGALRGTPKDIIGTLNQELNAAVDDPGIKRQIVEMGASALPGSPVEFGKLLAEETEKWAKVIKAAGIKAS